MTIIRKIQLRRDTAANWTSANPVLLSGEHALETDTRKTKIGDGVTAWTSLAYSRVNVGTTAGTVAAGDDSRIVNAIQPSGSYSDPSWITELAWSKITGEPDFARRDQDNSLVGNQAITGNITASGTGIFGTARPVTISGATGNITIKGDVGGWVTGLQFEGSTGAALGGFSTYGGGNTLINYFVGTFSNQLITVLENGAVGIGMSPSFKLDVTAAESVIARFANANGVQNIYQDTGGGGLFTPAISGWYTNDTQSIYLASGNGRVTITNSNGNIATNGNITAGTSNSGSPLVVISGGATIGIGAAVEFKAAGSTIGFIGRSSYVSSGGTNTGDMGYFANTGFGHKFFVDGGTSPALSITSAGITATSATPIIRLDGTNDTTARGIEWTSEGGAQPEAHIKHTVNSGDLLISSGRASGWGGAIHLIADTVTAMDIRETTAFCNVPFYVYADIIGTVAARFGNGNVSLAEALTISQLNANSTKLRIFQAGAEDWRIGMNASSALLRISASGTDVMTLDSSGNITATGTISIANGVWHRSLGDSAYRLFFGTNDTTYIAGKGTTPIQFRNASEQPLVSMDSNFTTYFHSSGGQNAGSVYCGNLTATGTIQGTKLQVVSGSVSSQILFGYAGSTLYSHQIKTRHDSGTAADNGIDFYVWTPVDSSSTPASVQVLAVTGTGIAVTGNITASGSIKPGTKTIATLPSAASSTGERYQVSDSATIVNRVAFSNGSAWYYEGTAVAV